GSSPDGTRVPSLPHLQNFPAWRGERPGVSTFPPARLRRNHPHGSGQERRKKVDPSPARDSTPNHTSDRGEWQRALFAVAEAPARLASPFPRPTMKEPPMPEVIVKRARAAEG